MPIRSISRGAGACLAWLLLAAAAVPARAQLDAVEREIDRSVRADAASMRDQLSGWVAINSGSRNAEGLGRMLELVGAELAALGFAVERFDGRRVGSGLEEAGPLLRARRPGPEGSPRLLLVGHVDTVFEPDAAFGELGPELDGRARGPGAADMKGGLVVMLRALAALRGSRDLQRARWTAIINSDEELGSPGSRAMIEAEARAADLGFVFESAEPGGAMIRSRRGIGQFELEVEGVAAHSGGAHHEGRSAILELAHQVIALEALTDYAAGVTVNVGVIEGGSKRNVVPERARAWIDVRFDTAAAGEALRERMLALVAEPHVPGTRARLRGALHRPPRPATPRGDALLERHAGVARDLGLASPAPIHAGGGTDGSLMAAIGLPVIDSMGVRGAGTHTDGEFVVLESLPERAALAAILWRRLIRAPLDAPGSGR